MREDKDPFVSDDLYIFLLSTSKDIVQDARDVSVRRQLSADSTTVEE